MADIGKVEQVEIITEMQRSYLDYAMSVIVARALPDVKDGLKPVQRRIIFAMHQLGVTSRAHYSKCAKVVGEVLGKYHPHGDVSVYDALVRLAQDFSMRYPLIDGQGNFGSVDGDSAAAMRYTECRLDAISDELMADIEKNTVSWTDNFDGSLKEPILLPTGLPNLLLNGASGIAVGMATNIPPHNLGEVVDAICHLVDNPDASLEDLMQFVAGPDFPTGGHIYDITEITAAYATGKGKIIMRAKAEIEETNSGRFQIIVTELPYQVNKATLITRIADLVKEKKLDGIADLRDESDRKGMRVVVEIKKDGKPQSILNNLFKHTAMQQSFPVNTVALVDGTPQTLTLKGVLSEFIKHRQVVITKRSEFDLAAARAREHILEGLKIAVDHIDAVIETIKRSKDADVARINLMSKFKLTEIQAVAILDMQLRRLAALERQKIEDELTEVRGAIAYLEGLLASPQKVLKLIKDELSDLKGKFGDARRTKVFKQKIGEFSEEDLIQNEPTIVTLTQTGYVKRQSPSSFRTQRRGGKGVSGITTKEEDTVAQLLYCKTHDNILFFTDRGRVFALRAYEVPEASRVSKGQAVVNLLDLMAEEKVLSVLPVSKNNSAARFIVIATKNGTVKKTNVTAFEAIRRSGIIAIKLEKGDSLRWAKLSSSTDNVFLISQKGLSIRFSEKDIRPTARDTMGVRGIKLKGGDEVIGMDILNEQNAKADLLVVSSRGLGKKTTIAAWNRQNRGGMGVKAANLTDRTGSLVIAHILSRSDESLVLTSMKGLVIKLPLRNVPRLGRDTQGVTLMRFSNPTDSVAAAAIITKDEQESAGPRVERAKKVKSRKRNRS